MTKSDDADLFELWLTAKDGDAFAELARRHGPVVFDIAARALGDRSGAQDVLQEALLDLALEPTRKPAEVGVVAWLVRFAICRARNQRSSERCRTRRQQIVGLRRPEEAMPDDRLELTEELEHALAVAEPEERTVLAMRYLHGWEYDRIAQALETSEGAARVRVHRALSSIRTKLGVDGATESNVARGMAAIALVPLSGAKLDAVIRSALDAAGVPVAPGSPVTTAPVTSGGSRVCVGLRAGLQVFGAVVLLAGAATSSGLPVGATSVQAGRETPQQMLATAASGLTSAASRAQSPRSSNAGWFGVARPKNWDGGALARLARGEMETGTERVAAARVVPAKSAVPASDEKLAAVVPPVPPAAAPVATGESLPSAFRPIEGSASAANCDSGSSVDGRADALGGFARNVIGEPAGERTQSDPAADDSQATESPAARRGAVSRGRAFESLDASERALVQEAAALVRDVVARVAVEPDAAGASAEPVKSRAHVRRASLRAVRLHVRAAQRDEPSGTPRLSARKAAKLSRVLSALVEFALAQNADAPGVRWPDGVDVTSALEAVIRALAGVSADLAARRPDIAAETPQAGTQASRRPDVR